MSDEYEDDDEFTECPYCLSEIPSEAKVCRYCRRDIGTPSIGYVILKGAGIAMLFILFLQVIIWFL